MKTAEKIDVPVSNVVKNDVWLKLTFSVPEVQVQAGQFVMLEVPDDSIIAPRPFTIFDFSKNELTLLVKAVGRGTKKLFKVSKGDVISILAPLGNPYPEEVFNAEEVIFIAGGSGIAGTVFLHRILKEKNIFMKTFAGFKTAKEVPFSVFNLRDSGDEVHIFTEDGSFGEKGFPVEPALESAKSESVVIACGPLGMLKSVKEKFAIPNVFLSLETKMLCGFGVCQGCAVEKSSGDGFFLVCKDGPTFKAEEIAL